MLSSRKELTSDARELKGELYCLPYYDKMDATICVGPAISPLKAEW